MTVEGSCAGHAAEVAECGDVDGAELVEGGIHARGEDIERVREHPSREVRAFGLLGRELLAESSSPRA
jgi:hypothetical protein